MKLSYLMLSLCLATAASQTTAEAAPPAPPKPGAAASQEAVPYHYGMKLDIHRVISIQEPQDITCEAVTTTMIYQDSSATRHSLSYLKIPSTCSSRG